MAGSQKTAQPGGRHMSFSSVLASAFTRAIQRVPIRMAEDDASGAAPTAPPVVDFDRRCLGGMRRARPAATVAIGVHRITCTNWSMGGFLVRDADDLPQPGDTLAGTFEMRAGSGHFIARVVRSDPDAGVFAAAFTELDPELKTAMRRA
jgi:hypothetical protein